MAPHEIFICSLPPVVRWTQVTVSDQWAMKGSDMGHFSMVTMETVGIKEL